jgi:hypothetical protein
MQRGGRQIRVAHPYAAGGGGVSAGRHTILNPVDEGCDPTRCPYTEEA